MTSPLRYLLQALNFAVFMAIIGYFSANPAVRNLEEGLAQVTLAIGHAGQPVRPCRERTAEELAALPPNMRQPMDCPRERSPVIVRLIMDGKPILDMTVNPPGAFKDQGIDIYRSIPIPAGKHHFVAKLKDSVREKDFNYVGEKVVDLAPADLLFIDFHAQMGGFLFK
ncbi:MAG TPA: hypothetical protein ENI99_06290 [Sedimenticola sp.]|nr:hypothetical protein [Sedimenticola sp.]